MDEDVQRRRLEITVVVPDGYWKCPICGGLVNAMLQECPQCGVPRPTHTEGPEAHMRVVE